MSTAGATMVCQTLKVVAMPSIFGMLSNLGLYGCMCLAVLENVVFDDHNREVDYSEKSVTGCD
ncbi:hypothetical protein D8674_015767 [Pyrus ussuriensis x Pyrus communis]|uniref:Uncharacterized protein n=1 Tax=Pyrus ussuriensis x Pyrus communis TaxID=2448454 RepID=A0A5N5FN64_9ROSA|nr:hypothetical protein D8674_042906 [Pyrus ussuriensis x Pyrus communis]KAB2624107.1 hypothetical protein D8674_015767 [Pyrus ussuriensis x Pyrus communis]